MGNNEGKLYKCLRGHEYIGQGKRKSFPCRECLREFARQEGKGLTRSKVKELVQNCPELILQGKTLKTESLPNYTERLWRRLKLLFCWLRG